MSTPPVEAARGALANKLRAVRSEDTPPSAPTPVAPGPTDPFEGAVEPVIEQRVAWPEALPRKRILSQHDLDHFTESPAFRELLGLIKTCNASVRGHKLSEKMDVSEVRPASNPACRCHPPHPRRGTDACPGDAAGYRLGINIAVWKPCFPGPVRKNCQRHRRFVPDHSGLGRWRGRSIPCARAQGACRVFLRELGECKAYRLRQWYGAQLSVLDVRDYADTDWAW